MSLFLVVNRLRIFGRFEHLVEYMALFRTWTTQKYERKKVTVLSKYEDDSFNAFCCANAG